MEEPFDQTNYRYIYFVKHVSIAQVEEPFYQTNYCDFLCDVNSARHRIVNNYLCFLTKLVLLGYKRMMVYPETEAV